MAKFVSQEMFDTVVQENMEEFGMSVEDAIKDAEDQFIAQGVNLNTIVKDMVLFKKAEQNGDSSAITAHPLMAALESLTAQLGQSTELNTENVVADLTVIRDQCDLDVAHRCLAGNNKAMPLLHACLQKVVEIKNDVLIDATLSSLAALLNGQPDIVTERDLTSMLGLLREKQQSGEPMLSWKHLAALATVLRYCCVMHEANRQHLVKAGVINPVVELLQEAGHSQGHLVRETCILLRTLTLDDDVRVPFGKAHDHAKSIVAETPALEVLLNLCRTYRDSEHQSVVAEIFQTLSKLSVRNEFCQQVLDLGGIDFILQALDNYVENQSIVVTSLAVLKTLAGNDNVKLAIGRAGGAGVMVNAVERHVKSEGAAHNAAAALAALCLRHPENAAKAVQAGAVPCLAQILTLHGENADILRQVCLATRNIVSRSQELCPPFLSAGFEEALNTRCMSRCPDEAKAALRDLGCDVRFKELWTGTRGEIPH